MKKLVLFSVFLSALILFSCSHEYTHNHDNPTNNENQLKIIRKDFQELLKDKKFEKAYSKISRNDGKNLRTVMEQNYNFTILDVPAKVIEHQGNTTYTFQVMRDSLNSTNAIDNLIVHIGNNQATEAYLVRYTNVNLTTSTENSLTYQNAEITPIVFNDTQVANRLTVLNCITFLTSACSGKPWDCGGSICGYNETTICLGSDGGGGDSGYVGGDSGTILVNDNPITNPVYSTPGYFSTASATSNAKKFLSSFPSVSNQRQFLLALPNQTASALGNYLNSIPYPSSTSNQVKNFVHALANNLTNSEWFLNQTAENQTNIINYLIQNNFSNESISFILDAIQASQYFEINAFEVYNQEYDNFRNQMSISERNKFDQLLPNRKMWYIVSAKKAFDKANELFPNTNQTPCSIHNGKGDAFRHTLWNAYCSLFIGTSLTLELTTAHEDRPPTYIYNNMENQMDLYNNERGAEISTYSNPTNILENVLNHLQNGYLRYLNNLNNSCQATSTSQLIPTDQ